MKKQVLVVTIIMTTIIIASAINIYAVGPGNIRFTFHNLSNNADSTKGLTIDERHQYSQGNYETSQVCIFCHTPHNASPSVPLWNKKMPLGSGGGNIDTWFTMYTSSSTLSATARSAKKPGPESLLCLSCHDGRTAINVVHNAKEAGATAGSNRVFSIGNYETSFDATGLDADGGIPLGDFGVFDGMWMNKNLYGSNLGKTAADPYAGTNLADDHPISFSYTQAQANKGDNFLNPIDTVTAKGPRIRFFGSDNRIECSTCHDPHVYYAFDTNGWRADANNTDSYRNAPYKELKPFLVMSNSGSKLCLACHNK